MTARLRILLALTTLLAAPLPARAEFCAGSVLVAEWKAGSSAFARKDYKEALLHLDPLANAGFAPALLFRGRLYAGGLGVARDADRAIVDFEGASRGGLESAGTAIDTLSEDMSANHVTELRLASKQVKFDVDGCPGKAEPLVPHYAIGKNVTLTPAQFAPWWAALGSYAKTHDQAGAVYLGTVAAFGFANWDQLVGTYRAREPLLMINPSLVAGVTAGKLTQQQALDLIMPPARAVVHEYAMGLNSVFDLDRYKGREIVGWPSEDNKPFFESIHVAIDMVDGLAPPMKAYADRVKHIQYRPRMAYSVTAEALINAAVDLSDAANPGILVLERPDTYAPIYYAMDLVSAGYLVAQRQERDDGLKPDQRCELLRLRIGVGLALDLAPEKISAARRFADSRGCAR